MPTISYSVFSPKEFNSASLEEKRRLVGDILKLPPKETSSEARRFFLILQKILGDKDMRQVSAKLGLIKVYAKYGLLSLPTTKLLLSPAELSHEPTKHPLTRYEQVVAAEKRNAPLALEKKSTFQATFDLDDKIDGLLNEIRQALEFLKAIEGIPNVQERRRLVRITYRKEKMKLNKLKSRLGVFVNVSDAPQKALQAFQKKFEILSKIKGYGRDWDWEQHF